MKNYLKSPNGDGSFGYMKTVDNQGTQKYNKIADDFEMVYAYKNIDTGQITFTLNVDGEKTERISANEVEFELNDKCYTVSSGIKNDVLAYIRQQYKELLCAGKVKHIYEDIGWHNGVFRGYSADSANAPNGKAYYDGIFDLKPRGTKADFVNDLKKVVIGHTELETSVILGLSSCVVGFLKSHGVIHYSLVVNIFGSSTTGKTTSAKLAVSMGGSPHKTYKHDSLARTCSATQNALVAQLRGNNGYAVLFDELGSLDKKVNIIRLIFDMASGAEKQRLDKACNFRFDKSWATTILFTGEASLLEGQKVVDGIKMRLLSFDNAQWTKSDKQAREIETFSQKYSGLPLTLLAEYITSYSPNVIKRAFNILTIIISKRLDIPYKFRVRKAESIAVMMLTALLAQRAFGVKLSIKNLENFIVSNENHTCCSEQWRIAYWDFVQFVAMNGKRFVRKQNAPFSKVFFYHDPYKPKNIICTYFPVDEINAIGFRCFQEYDNQEAYCVGITVSAFERWFNESGYSNIDDTLRKWRDELKVLILPKGKGDRLRAKNRITENGNDVPFYHILLRQDVNIDGTKIVVPNAATSPPDNPYTEEKKVEDETLARKDSNVSAHDAKKTEGGETHEKGSNSSRYVEDE